MTSPDWRCPSRAHAAASPGTLAAAEPPSREEAIGRTPPAHPSESAGQRWHAKAPWLQSCGQRFYPGSFVTRSAAPRTVRRGRLNGDADLQDGCARLGVDADRATVALLDDASCDVKTKTRALAHVLCGVERLECAGRYVPWHAGAGVADFNDDVSPVSPGRYSQSAGAVHRVDGVIDEVGPHLVEFAGVGLDPGDDAVVTYDVDVVELVAEHHQGAFQAVADVDALDRSSVHL